MPPLLTLGQLVEEACAQFAPADAPTRYYDAALHHAAAFRRELIAGTSRYLKTVALQVGFDRTCPLPEDYVEYTALGVQLPGWPHTRNLIYNGAISGITLPVAQPFGITDYLTPPTDYECAQARYGLEGGYCGYGVGSWGGEFRIDHAEGRIICNSRLPTDALLHLEYFAFGAPDGEDIAIDPLAHSWGIQFILWKLYLQKQNVQMAREHERLAEVEKTRFINRTRPFSLEGAMQAKRRAAAQSWK